MSEVILERRFRASPQRLFAFVSEPANIAKWWGPENGTVAQASMDFTRTGPWSSLMQVQEGRRYKVTGEVIAVDPPHAIEFTWAWHGENDVRGHESRVRMQIMPGDAGGSRLILHHYNLSDEESATNHTRGWEAALRRLTAMDA